MQTRKPGDIRLHYENQDIERAVETICRDVAAAGGCAHAVGGCVRDAVLGLPAHDIDIEVFGLPPEQLTQLLAARFPVNLVGRAFGVIKIQGLPLDVSLPRRESTTGNGHRDFHIRSDPSLSFREAAARRDFTINAIALNPLENTLIDPYHGLDDLQARRLRHTSSHFAEDPLRVLRAMQFIARFELHIMPETLALCQTLSPDHLPRERILDEWRKLILLGRQPSRGLAFLRESGWIHSFPELAALIDWPQDPRWHPEGDVWNHTLACLDAFASERTENPTEDLIVGFAVLCHDMGKPLATQFYEDAIRAHGHEAAGEQPARAFLERMTSQTDFVNQVLVLVTHHMCVGQLFKSDPTRSAIRRLARKVGRIDRLVRVDRADRIGRTPPSATPDLQAPAWLLEQAQNLILADSPPEPLLKGRHLLDLGLAPGPHFKPLLEAAFAAQLAGALLSKESALDFARAYLDRHAV